MNSLRGLWLTKVGLGASSGGPTYWPTILRANFTQIHLIFITNVNQAQNFFPLMSKFAFKMAALKKKTFL